MEENPMGVACRELTPGFEPIVFSAFHDPRAQTQGL